MFRDRSISYSDRMPVNLKRIFLITVVLGISMMVILTLSPSAQAAGKNIYVAPNGNNKNSGTISQPLKTIQAAIDRARAGDTVYVHGGTYVETVRITRSGNSGNPITVKAYPGETPVIDGRAGVACLNCGLPNDPIDTNRIDPKTGRGHNWSSLVSIEGNHINFEGFIIKRSMGRGIRIWDKDSKVSNVTVRNNTVNDSRSNGILLEGTKGTEHILIENNVVWHAQSHSPWVEGRNSSIIDWGSAVTVKNGNRITIRGNTIYENWGEGILVDANNGGSTNIIVEDNVVYDNFALQIYIHRVENMTVQRNLVYHTNNPDFRRGGNPSSCIVVANEPQFNGSLVTNNIDIINNIAVGCRQNFAVWGSNDQVLKNFLVAHNTFVNAVTNTSNTARAISLENDDTINFNFENNVVYEGITTNRHEVGYAAPGVFYANNLWFPYRPENGQGAGSGDIVGKSPRFADSRAYDLPETWTEQPNRFWFRVKSNSPVIDQGKISQPFLSGTDIFLDLFFGLRDPDPDLGVHEFGSFPPGMSFMPAIVN